MNEWTFSPIPEISANFAKIRKFPANQHFLCFLRKFLSVSWNSGQNSSKFCWKMTKFWKFSRNFLKKCKKNHEVFFWKFEIWAVQRNGNLVDVDKCWKMRLLSWNFSFCTSGVSCLWLDFLVDLFKCYFVLIVNSYSELQKTQFWLDLVETPLQTEMLKMPLEPL